MQLTPLPTEVDTAFAPGGETILVVDDEEELQSLAKESLEALGYKVLTASDGLEALAIILREPGIDAIFTDVVMPGGMNGYDLTERALAVNPSLKIQITSGYTEKITFNGEPQQLRNNLLHKPYSLVELAQTMQGLFGDFQAKVNLQPSTILFGNQMDPVQSSILNNDSMSHWDNNLDIGIESIDADHQELFTLIVNSNKTAENATPEEFDKILGRLREQTTAHFEYEEAIMEACEYPGLPNHRQVHMLLLRHLDESTINSHSGLFPSIEKETFPVSWLIEHIEDMDQAFARYCELKPGRLKNAIERMNACTES